MPSTCPESGSVESFASLAEPAFASWRAAGAREAGVLVTLDVANNFPQLPVRTDGPYLLWLGIVRDDNALKTQVMPAVDQSVRSLNLSPLLRGPAELIVLDPTPRSRMRFLLTGAR